MKFLKPFLMMTVMIQLFSCSTTYSNVKLTSDDCMVLIPVGIDRPSGTDLARTYTLQVSGMDHTINIPKTTRGYTMVKIRKDSQNIISLRSKVTNSKYTGSSSKDEIFRDLPYSPGKIVICDFRIIQKIKKVNDHSFTSSINFYPITEAEKDDLVKKFLSEKTNSSWVE